MIWLPVRSNLFNEVSAESGVRSV
eukprot:SAG22_NODE_6956_length_791_cov_1.101156_2_plen_23_part_01